MYPVATKENKLPVLYAVRGFNSVPDSNLESLPGLSESVIRVNTYMGGSCLHKVDREGCPIYIERLVSNIRSDSFLSKDNLTFSSKGTP